MRIGNNFNSPAFRAIKSINYTKQTGTFPRQTDSCFAFKDMSEEDVDLFRTVKTEPEIQKIAEKNDIDIEIEAKDNAFSASASISIKSRGEAPDEGRKIDVKYIAITKGINPDKEQPKQALVEILKRRQISAFGDGEYASGTSMFNTEQVQQLSEKYKLRKTIARHEECHDIIDSLIKD